MVLKIGIISLGSKSSRMIIDEAKHFFDEVEEIDIRKIEVKIDSKTEVLYDGEPLKNYDCLYMRGSYKYSSLLYAVSEHFKGKCYLPLSANAHVIGHDKFKTHLKLSQVSSIKMPNTYFTAKITEAKTFLNDSGSRESDFESEIDNMSTASIWIENDGVPFRWL